MGACRDISKLNPIAYEACKLFLKKCEEQGFKVGVCETIRTAEYQNELYQQGRTKKGSIITNCDGYKNKSVHQSGFAFDIFQNIKGKEWESSFYDKVCKIAKNMGLECGHYWSSFKDSPHIEVPKNWKAPIEKQDETYLKAVDKLIEKGIISSGNLWKNDTFSKDNVHSLIIKMASKL